MRISSGDVDLEARWDLPEGEHQRAVVFCHPHPQFGGTMRAPLMHRVAKVMVSRGLAVLRFNFRGVGESTGEWGDGLGEIEDVGAAMETATADYGSAVALAGWSFGAAASLRWQAQANSGTPYAGIAPPVSGPLTPTLPRPSDLAAGRRLFVLGDRDQFVAVDDLGDYARSIDATLEVIEGSDHFFNACEQTVGEILAGFFVS